jgi:zinc protease
VPAARFDAKAPDKANAVLRMHQALALSVQDTDYLPAVLVAHVLGGGALENRLAVRVRQQEGLSYSVSAGLNAPWHGNAAALEINASFSPADRERLISLVSEELQKLAERGITEAELARARNDLLQAWQQGRNSDANLASQLLSLADQQRDWLALHRREQSLLTLSPEQVNAAWRRLVRPEAFVISSAGDYKD